MVPWEDPQLSTSKTVFRLIFIAALLHTSFFARHLVGLRGLVWTMHAAMERGVCLSDGVRRAPSKPSLAIRKAPMEVEGSYLPPVGYKTISSMQRPALDWGLQVVL